MRAKGMNVTLYMGRNVTKTSTHRIYTHVSVTYQFIDEGGNNSVHPRRPHKPANYPVPHSSITVH